MTEPDELSIDHAVSIATRLFRKGRIEDARVLYERVIEAAPEHADALHFLGILYHETGESERGIDLIRRAAVLAPDHPDVFNNLGNICKECDRLDEAESAYRHALRLRPDFAAAHNNLGVILRKRDEAETALASFRKAIDCDARLVDAYGNLFRLLVARGRTEEARMVATRWNEVTEDDALAQHSLAALSGGPPPDRCSDEYVERTFDGFARDFDAVLTSLNYAGPLLLQTALEACGLEAGSNDVLDAGCGTGLCADVLRPFARRLTGVDLSGGMLDRARRRGGYDALVRAELTAYLLENPDTFDVIAAMDTLNYFGELVPVLTAACKSLRDGGTFVFVLEHASDLEAPAGIDLQSHGRYRHSRAYIASAIAAAGLRFRSLEEVVLRTDQGSPVHAALVTSTK